MSATVDGHDGLVAPGRQLDGALRPPQPRRQPLEHQIDGHLDEIGCADPHPSAGVAAFGVDLDRPGGLGVAAAQTRRRCQKRRGHTAVRVAVQAVGPAEAPAQ